MVEKAAFGESGTGTYFVDRGAGKPLQEHQLHRRSDETLTCLDGIARAFMSDPFPHTYRLVCYGISPESAIGKHFPTKKEPRSMTLRGSGRFQREVIFSDDAPA
jgi:hypothetical protein